MEAVTVTSIGILTALAAFLVYKYLTKDV